MGDVRMKHDPLLKIDKLSKVFTGQAEDKRVLDHIDLTIDEQEFLCILGPSGCGKTTLLRCIAGFEKFEGRILVNHEIKNAPGTDRIMVFQDFNQLFPWKTVEANIQYPLKVNGIKDRNQRKAISDHALQKVQLTGYEKYYPYQLSGGMKQRVAIAKALALKPEIILMDEPFAALDAMTRSDLQNELLRIAQEEACTIIFVTHNIQEALILGKRILVLTKGGRIVYDQKNIIKRPVSPASEGYGEMWQQLNNALSER